MFSEKGAWNYTEKIFQILSIPSFLLVLYQIYKQERLPHSVYESMVLDLKEI